MPSLATTIVSDVAETALLVTRETVTGTKTITARTYFRCDATGGAFAITLPLAQNLDGRIIIIKKMDATANAITVTRAGSDTIDGATTFVLTTQYDSVILVCDQDNDTWDIVATV